MKRVCGDFKFRYRRRALKAESSVAPLNDDKQETWQKIEINDFNCKAISVQAFNFRAVPKLKFLFIYLLLIFLPFHLYN